MSYKAKSFEARLKALLEADNNPGKVIGEKSIINPWIINFYR
jgi:hypothetical protein